MPKELTVRGLIIGIIITLVFTAANVYFGLKAGLTFSTSIPAAVISMAILRGFRDATVQENNIVQTVASAAGEWHGARRSNFLDAGQRPDSRHHFAIELDATLATFDTPWIGK